MATSNQRNSQKQDVPPVVIALAVAGVLAFTAFMGYRTFGPQGPPKLNHPGPTAQQKANNDFLVNLARQTGGDISKASPQDVERLQAITGGNGAMALKSAYQNQ